jgi:hypothetical protein
MHADRRTCSILALDADICSIQRADARHRRAPGSREISAECLLSGDVVVIDGSVLHVEEVHLTPSRALLFFEDSDFTFTAKRAGRISLIYR